MVSQANFHDARHSWSIEKLVDSNLCYVYNEAIKKKRSEIEVPEIWISPLISLNSIILLSSKSSHTKGHTGENDMDSRIRLPGSTT